MTRFRFALLAVMFLLGGEVATAQVRAVTAKLRAKFELDEFYQKHIDVHGLPVVGSGNVSDAALKEAAWIVDKMLGHRPDILKAMADNRTRLAVMAFNEYTTDIPEHRHLEPRVYWDRRARGLGATPSAPAVSCAEENLLCHPNDPYESENICIHEFAHAIHQMGMKEIDPQFNDRLNQAFQNAMADGKWSDTYAASNAMEYWAEGVQSWFDDNRENDALHNGINTRAELKKYDPALAALCEQVFDDLDWRYEKPTKRQANECEHLEDVDFDQLPEFRWRQEIIPEVAHVLIQTTQGDIKVELYATQAPKTVANFLHYVHSGFYSDGLFHRSVTLANQPDNDVKIEVIQASADPSAQAEFPAAIVLEKTSTTGVKHLDGTISMARAAPNSAQDHFFICIGDQPELDFGGRRNPDGQGFAAFGKVIEGMDVVKAIQSCPTKDKGQQLYPAIKIQRAIRLN